MTHARGKESVDMHQWQTSMMFNIDETAEGCACRSQYSHPVLLSMNMSTIDQLSHIQFTQSGLDLCHVRSLDEISVPNTVAI